MKIKSFFKLSSFVLAVSLFPLFPMAGYAEDSAHKIPKDFSETFHLPDVTAKGPGIYIKYHFTKKEDTSSLDRTPSAEHFSNRIFRLFEDNKVWYGLYAFEGDPLKDRRFTGFYLNVPRDEEDSVLYIRIDYDNKTHKFKEQLIMPDGRKVSEEGTFEIVANR